MSAVKEKCLARLAELKDEFVRLATDGRFTSAAAAEWAELPMRWRMALLLMAGVGDDESDLATLAARSWREMPPTEREALRFVCRDAKKHIGNIKSLVTRVNC